MGMIKRCFFSFKTITLNETLSMINPQNGRPNALNTWDMEPTIARNSSSLINVCPNGFFEKDKI